MTDGRYSKRMLLAFGRTVRAYRKLIADPEKERPKWVDYGDADACRMCIAVDVRAYPGLPDCARCVIGRPDYRIDQRTPCGDATMSRLTETIVHEEGSAALIWTSQARLRWLLRKAQHNGVTYDDSTGEAIQR